MFFLVFVWWLLGAVQVARWPPASATTVNTSSTGKTAMALQLVFSHPFDPHLGCDTVTATTTISCDPGNPGTTMTGHQVCRPGHHILAPVGPRLHPSPLHHLCGFLSLLVSGFLSDPAQLKFTLSDWAPTGEINYFYCPRGAPGRWHVRLGIHGQVQQHQHLSPEAIRKADGGRRRN